MVLDISSFFSLVALLLLIYLDNVSAYKIKAEHHNLEFKAPGEEEISFKNVV